MQYFIFLYSIVAKAETPVKKELDKWEKINQPVFEEPDLEYFVRDFSHAFNQFDIENGYFYGEPNAINYSVTLMKDDMDLKFYTSLKEKYSPFLNKSYSSNTSISICFNSKKDKVLFLKKEYYTTILDTVGHSIKDVMPQEALEYKINKTWDLLSIESFGEPLFKEITSLYDHSSVVKISTTDIPNALNSVLELSTEDDKKIRIPISLDAEKLTSDAKIFWVLNGHQTEISVDLNNPLQLDLFEDVLKNGSSRLNLRQTTLNPKNNIQLDEFNYQIHLIDNQNRWFGVHEFKIPHSLDLSLSNGCDLDFTYIIQEQQENIIGISLDTWKEITDFKTIDSDLYEYTVVYDANSYTQNSTNTNKENENDFILNAQFDELIARPQSCKLACQQIFEISESYVKSHYYDDVYSVISEVIPTEDCLQTCENSLQYSDCINDVLNLQLPKGFNKEEIQASTIAACQKAISPELSIRKGLLNGRINSDTPEDEN